MGVFDNKKSSRRSNKHSGDIALLPKPVHAASCNGIHSLDDSETEANRNKREFKEWLDSTKQKSGKANSIVNTLEQASEQLVLNKLADTQIWEIASPAVFEDVYHAASGNKMFRIRNRRLYLAFLKQGKLYKRFLKERLYSRAVKSASSEQPTMQIVGNSRYNTIDCEAVISWLTTQPDNNGTPHLENVARQYMNTLRSAPARLFPLDIENRDVFACRTADELDTLWNAFKLALNYSHVNNSTSGALSAGLNCYRRYLAQCIEDIDDTIPLQQAIHGSTVSESQCNDALKSVLVSCFSNGFLINSPIEIVRLRQFYLAKSKEELKETDTELTSVILSMGVLLDEKVYVLPSDAVAKIKHEISRAIASGTEIIFYEEFFARHESCLFSSNIVSVELLKIVLKREYPNYGFKKNYFTPNPGEGTEVERIKLEILRTWGSESLRSYKELSQFLPYLPVGKIRQALAANSSFVRNARGVYGRTKQIDIDEAEMVSIKEYVDSGCRKDGFVSMSDIPLGEITERNHEMTLPAIRNAIFAMLLEDRFDKHDKIITSINDCK